MTNRIWVTSDWHFYHKKMLEGIIGSRPHNYMRKIMGNYEKVVDEDDTVYFLGDMCFQPHKFKQNFAFLLRTSLGQKILVRGNHDDKKRFPDEYWLEDCGFSEVHDGPIIVDGWILSHFPTVDNRFHAKAKEVLDIWENGVYNGIIHGHVHDYVLDFSNHICVCPEQTNYELMELK